MSPNYPLAHEIIPGLWLGSIESADISFLIPRKIFAVLTIVGDFRSVKSLGRKIKQKIIIMNDGDPYHSEDIANGLTFISENLSNDINVLVHCMAGVSRSSSMVAGYLMKKFGWNPLKAIQYVSSIREVVSPATETYNSVINFFYDTNQTIFCRICFKKWIYIPKYDFFYQSKVYDHFCGCTQPDLAIRRKKH